MVGGSKEKQTNAEKGGEGVQNPGNFADVLYVWSLTEISFNMRSRFGELRAAGNHEDGDFHARLFPRGLSEVTLRQIGNKRLK